MTKLWVDDTRRPPDATWAWAKTSADAILALGTNPTFDVMSLDHDLGQLSTQELRALTDEEAEDPYNCIDTTRKVVLWLCSEYAEGRNYWPAVVWVHTSNPVGREWLEGMVARYKP